MEFDKLKDIWQKGDTSSYKVQAEIASMLKGRSQSPIAKMKRNLWMELILTGVAWLVLLYFSYTIPNGALKWSFISFLALFMCYIVYYIMQLNTFRNFDSSGNLRTNLEHLIRNLERYLRFYRLSYSIIYPAYFLLILLFIIIDRGFSDFVHHLMDAQTIINLIFLIVILLSSSLWITNWYLKKMYGNHIQRLKDLLHDISSTDS